MTDVIDWREFVEEPIAHHRTRAEIILFGTVPRNRQFAARFGYFCLKGPTASTSVGQRVFLVPS